MVQPSRPRTLALIVAAFTASACTVAEAPARTESSYDDLVVLFEEWRDFERPAFVDGVPDYAAEAMDRQHDALGEWKARLWALEVDDWPVEQQIDWHLVRAEMNGLDFDHTVRRPWARDPPSTS